MEPWRIGRKANRNFVSAVIKVHKYIIGTYRREHEI